MINYTTDLMNIVNKVTDNVLVATTYPDTNIVPIVILYESNQTVIHRCSEYEHASSTVIVEVYAKDIPTRNKLKNSVDLAMQDMHFELVKKEDIDNDPIYVCKLTYQCEVLQIEGEVRIYNKKY